MKQLFLLVLLLWPALLSAQISATAADFTARLNNSTHKQYEVSFTTYPQMDMGTASPSAQTWNFQSIPSYSSVDSNYENFRTAQLTPRNVYFPAATHGSYDSTESGGALQAVSLFYQVGSDALYSLGIALHYKQSPFDTVVIGIHKPRQLLMPIPFALGQTRVWTDTIDFMGKKEIRTDEFYVNGYGTCTFPNRTTAPALRMRKKLVKKVYVGGVLNSTEMATSIEFWAQDFTHVGFDMADTGFTSGTGTVKGIKFGTWGNPTAISSRESSNISSFALEQNYPNPFNPSTRINYNLPAAATVRLAVYDALGNEIALLANGRQTAGRHQVVFNGSGLPSGVYFYRLSTETNSETKKFTLLK